MKKLLALILVFMIVLSTVAYALPSYYSNRIVICEDCGATLVNSGVSYGGWEVVEVRHTSNGDMYKWERTVTYTDVCPNCGRVYTSVVIQWKWSDMNI